MVKLALNADALEAMKSANDSLQKCNDDLMQHLQELQQKHQSLNEDLQHAMASRDLLKVIAKGLLCNRTVGSVEYSSIAAPAAENVPLPNFVDVGRARCSSRPHESSAYGCLASTLY